MPSQPLDYQTYDRILTLATLRKSLRPGLSVATALQGLAEEQPGRPEYAQAYARYIGRPPVQARVAVAKQTPAAPAAASAWETLDKDIRAEQQAHPDLSYAAAAGAVIKRAPDLHTAYVLEHHYHPEVRTRPVEKAAAPSVEAIIAKAQTQAAAEHTTTAAMLEKLATADPGQYYPAYARWHGSPGYLREHHARGQA